MRRGEGGGYLSEEVAESAGGLRGLAVCVHFILVSVSVASAALTVASASISAVTGGD
jgi:hypothetical protein